MQHGWTKPILTEREIKTFIVMTLRLEKMSEEEIVAMDLKKAPRPRPAQLAFLYVGALKSLKKVNSVVGNVVAIKHFLPFGKFEGPLFHDIYRQIVQLGETPYGPDISESEVERIFNIVTSNGRNVRIEVLH